MTANPHGLVVDRAVQKFLESIDGRPTTDGRDEPLHGGFSAFDVDEHVITVDAGDSGLVQVHIIRPAGAEALLPAVVYLHGDRCVAGNVQSHARVVAHLALGSGVTLIVPERPLGATHPVGLEQAYATTRWICTNGHEWGIDPSRIAVAGDSCGARVAIALVLLSLRRNEFRFSQLVAFTPVTDVECDTESCRQFAEGYFLRREHLLACMDRDVSDGRRHADPTIAPLHADAEDLARFPASLVVTAEADVVRDQGEAFAARLRAAGAATTAVRYEGTVHGFVTLEALRDTGASRAALAQAVAALRVSLRT